jgi:ornithine lipid hydroxylase
MSKILDYLIPFFFFGAAVFVTHFLMQTELLSFYITGLTIGPLVVLAFILERVRPERLGYLKFDQPIIIDILHYLFNYNLGVVLGYAISVPIGSWLSTKMGPPLWPHDWPLFIQLTLIIVLVEMFSYWQHRLYHISPFLWKFHALHHKGESLNLIRTGRFHFMDITVATIVAILPLEIMGAPKKIHLYSLSMIAVLGIIQHANIRMRTPKWINYFFCGPAVHRHHHSIKSTEMNTNFGTYIMIFDVIFGTYQVPNPSGPDKVGIEPDNFSLSFWEQFIGPFRK